MHCHLENLWERQKSEVLFLYHLLYIRVSDSVHLSDPGCMTKIFKILNFLPQPIKITDTCAITNQKTCFMRNSLSCNGGNVYAFANFRLILGSNRTYTVVKNCDSWTVTVVRANVLASNTGRSCTVTGGFMYMIRWWQGFCLISKDYTYR